VNGSGKTTLLRTLVGELACLWGEVYQQPRTLVHLGLSQYDLLYTHTYIYIYVIRKIAQYIAIL
jgi:ABC-type cobalamin/Fe3+-siderophores transport system ATPase subunit